MALQMTLNNQGHHVVNAGSVRLHGHINYRVIDLGTVNIQAKKQYLLAGLLLADGCPACRGDPRPRGALSRLPSFLHSFLNSCDSILFC